jgi:hypothetical protein
MTKTLSNAYRQKCLDSTAPDLSSVNLKVVALSSAYTYSSAHDFLDDIAAGTVATTGNLASKTITNGVLDFADVSLGSPAGGSTITQLWLYYDTGTPATSLLIAYTDEDANGSLSVATNGEAITLVVNASGMFRV